MEYIYSAMILHSAGKEITEDAVAKVLKAAGVAPDESRIKALTASLEGVNIDEAMKSAIAAPVVAAAPAAGGAHAAEPAKKAEKKEEKVSEEQAAAGLGALFG